MKSGDRLTLAALSLLTTALSVALVVQGRASLLEALSFVTGAVCVWLTVRESIWNFPIGLVNVAAFFVVFASSRLFADAGLQVVYFVLGVMGWVMWLQRDDSGDKVLAVSRAPAWELAATFLFIGIATLGMWQVLNNVGGSASFWDALTTSTSLAAQWLLNRKRLENWVAWIIVDVIYVPLYLYKELYLTALLYAIFLVMAVMGLRAWHASWLARRNAPAASAEVAV